MKHGILMMAHNNAEVVKACLRLLDDERFTVFLLVDAKSALCPEDFLPQLRHMHCEILERQVINWAAWSQVEGEFSLMEAGVRAGCDYLHFLQGADLPMKTPDEMDIFFTDHAGCNFLDPQPWRDELARYKVLVRHYFLDHPAYRTSMIRKGLRYGLALIQSPFMPKKTVRHCSALFSITGDFARWLLDRRGEIKKVYGKALAPDEVYLINELDHSPFRETLADESGARLIDWGRAQGHSPHTFTMEDLPLLKQGIEQPDIMFARKFQANTDMEIVNAVEELLLARCLK